MAATSSIPLFCMLPLLALFSVVVCSAAQAAPAPAVDCTSLVLNMADCLSFVTDGSTLKKPEGMCCSGLKTVLKTDADCLCETFRNSAQLGVTIDVKKAFTLPASCHVSAPSVGNCGPLSPAALPLSPSNLGTSIGANDVSPTPVPASSGWSATRSSMVLLILLKMTVFLVDKSKVAGALNGNSMCQHNLKRN